MSYPSQQARENTPIAAGIEEDDSLCASDFEGIDWVGERYHSSTHHPPILHDLEYTRGYFIKRRLMETFDPTEWLLSDVNRGDSGEPLVPEGFRWTLPSFFRTVFYNPVYPEFTSIQQFSWAVMIGITMGVYTALWKALIEDCVELVWKTLPELLLTWGVFTDPQGRFPIYHYMWITPALFGGTLSYIFSVLPTPIPGQNEWIHNLHSRGVQDSETFVLLFVLSTAGMVSGLSLGPELPLILTAGMIGSSLGVVCKQSILSARVLNLTASAAAIGGFFGFPMAGALFVMEVPHRMGLQYFEALTPATIASIVAVLTNRLVTGNDVTGYYEYPFLNQTLPSSIFHDAIVFGLFGGAVGILYTKVVLVLKKWVHSFLKCEEVASPRNRDVIDEISPLLAGSDSETEPIEGDVKLGRISFGLMHEPTRAATVGMIVGTVVGITCIFVPHVMFWGESQLQNLIDKGRTPLPVFGLPGEPSRGLVALGVCMEDSEEKQFSSLGFSLGCSALIACSKILVTGLSLGTGIIGGHFWAPLFVGCAASHFLTDLVRGFSTTLGFELSLSSYPCVALLCSMGSCHVVPFRAHMAIILILTLTVDAFDPEDEVGGAYKVAGDYSAVFPLLTVSVFVALQVSRQVTFYETQRSRGDITALPQVLCEPGKEGRPLVVDYDDDDVDDCTETFFGFVGETGEEVSPVGSSNYRTIDDSDTQIDIEIQFERDVKDQRDSSQSRAVRPPRSLPPRPLDHSLKPFPLQKAKSTISHKRYSSQDNIEDGQRGALDSPTRGSKDSLNHFENLLNAPPPCEKSRTLRKPHRRTQSDPIAESLISMNLSSGSFGSSNDTSTNVGPYNGRVLPSAVALKRVSSFGQIDQEQPSLLDQARKRAASFATTESSKNVPKYRSSSYSGPPNSGSFDVSGPEH